MSGTDGLLEREGAAGAVRGVLAGVQRAEPEVLFLVGEAGQGKTSLVEGLCAETRGRVRIGAARGHPMDTALGFGMASQVLDSVGAPSLLAIDETAPTPYARTVRLQRVLHWLRQTDRPQLLVLDDLHWADPDSLLLVSFLCRRLAGLPVGVVATMRPWPPAAADLSAELTHEGYGTVVRLTPLSEPAAEALLTRRIGRPPSPEVAGRAWRLCGGNPLLLQQVAVAIGHGEVIPEPRAAGFPAPSTDLVLARFAGLPAAGLSCAQAAAVLGGTFMTGVAAEIAHLADDDVDQALDAMARSGLTRTGGAAGTEFVHPLFAQALYEDLSGPLRTRLHARAFAALAARGRDTEAAEHAVRAELIGDPLAIDVLHRVGLAARHQGAITSAAQRLQAATQLAGDRATPDLLLVLAEVLLEAGRSGEAATVTARLLARPDLSLAVRLQGLRLEGRALVFAGCYEQAQVRLRQMTALAEASDPGAAIDSLLDHAVILWAWTGPGAALPLLTRAREIATHAQTPAPQRDRIEAAWINLALQGGQPADDDDLTRAIDDLHSRLPGEAAQLGGIFGPLFSTAFTALLTERFADAEKLLGAAREGAETHGALEAMATISSAHARALAYVGRLDDAMAVLEIAHQHAAGLPMLEFYGCVGAACVTHLQGHLERSTAWGDRLERLAPDQDLVLLYVRELRAQRHLRAGRLTEASDAYRDIEATVRRIGVGEPCLVYWARHAVTAHLGHGRTPDAERVVGWLAEHSEPLPCRWPRIALATTRAALAAAAGHHPRAVEYFQDALAHHEHVTLPIEKIETLLEYGSYLRRTGHPTQSRPVLAEALELVDTTGAHWYTPPLRDELALAGGRRRRPRDTPDQLTPAETRIARQVTAGHSNPQVAANLSLSIHTVEGHLDRIYNKLGIHSRGELIAHARAELTGA